MWRSFLAADDGAPAAAASAAEEELRSGPVAMGPDPACSAQGSGGAEGSAGPDRTGAARVWSLGAAARAREILNRRSGEEDSEEEERVV